MVSVKHMSWLVNQGFPYSEGRYSQAEPRESYWQIG